MRPRRFIARSVLTGLLGALMSALPARAENPDGSLRYEAFWERQASADASTLAVYDFEAPASAASELSDDDLTGRGERAAVPSAAKAGKFGQASLSLRGDAAAVPGGRWGGGVKLGGRGAVEIGGLQTAQVLLTDGACTVDFWIKPDEEKNAPADSTGPAHLIAFSAAAGLPTFRLERGPDDHVSLWFGDQRLLTHRGALRPGAWTHVALVISYADATQRVSALVLLDGRMMRGDTDALPVLPPATLKNTFSGPLTLGNAGVPAESRGLRATLDAIRISRGGRGFYEQQDTSWHGAGSKREVAQTPPFFVSPRPATTYLAFEKTGVQPAPPGVRGNALLLTGMSEKTSAGLAPGAAVNPERGSVEFWFQPVGWNNFAVRGAIGDGLVTIPVFHVKPAGGTANDAAMSLTLAAGRVGRLADEPFVPMHPGAWTHVLCSWSPDGCEVYLNGEPQPGEQVGLVVTESMTLYKKWLGENDGAGRPWGLFFEPSQTLIDEFRIYDRALSRAEARHAYARFFPDAPARMKPLPPLDATLRYFPYRSNLRIDLACLPTAKGLPGKIRASLTTAEGKALPPLETPLGRDGTARLEMPCSPGFGSHQLALESFDGEGQPLIKTVIPFVREKPPWWANSLGKERRVPRPWTPIRVEQNRLEVIGRTITLGAGGLPVQMRAEGADLLASGATIHAEVGGKPAALTAPGTEKIDINAAPDRATWRSVLASPGVRASVEAGLEYDGLMKFTIVLTSDPPAASGSPASPGTTLDRLWIDIPLSPSHAAQLIANPGNGAYRGNWTQRHQEDRKLLLYGGNDKQRGGCDVRMMPRANGKLWDSLSATRSMTRAVVAGSFCPLIWIGDDERGVAFFGESDRGWTPNSNVPAQELIGSADRVTYRMNILSQPVTLNEPRSFTFYIQPTPTKPRAADWRTFNRVQAQQPMSTYASADELGLVPLTSRATASPAKYTFAVEPVTWDDAAKLAARCRGSIGSQNPLLKYMHAGRPVLGPSMNEFADDLFSNGSLTWTPEVEDYCVWLFTQYLERGLIDGLYLDECTLSSTLDPGAGAYALPDGRTQPGFTTLGKRRFLQRLWNYCDAAGKRPHLVAQSTFNFEVPALSFCEAVINCYDRMIPINSERDFIDTWPLEPMRVMAGGKFGWVPLIIPPIRGGHAEFTYYWYWHQSRAMHAMTLQHDYWYAYLLAWGNTIKPAMVSFGEAHPTMRFIPYYNSAPCVTVDSKSANANAGNLLVSLYAAERKALVFVSNLEKQDRTATLELHPQALFNLPRAKLTWRDVDPALRPAPHAPGTAGTKETPANTTEADPLTGETAKLADPYALELRDGRATFQVRTHDFRIFEVTADP